MDGEAAARVFVYGTLMPGHLRWDLLSGAVVAHEPAATAGRLYDTGWGYPAARFDEPGRIDGVVCRLDPARRDEVWALLDRVEGNQYRRREVVLDDDTSALAYEFVGPVDRFVVLDGRWDGV